MEDRIYASGKGEAFSAAVDKFEKGNKSRASQQVLYDELVALGASAEEADEYVDLLCSPE